MASSNTEPPLVTVTNPVTYLRRWWEKVMGKEGIDFKFTIHPITAVLITAVVATVGFGAGRFIVPDGIKIPFFEFGNTPTSTPISDTEEVWKETAFSGKLQHSSATNKYFLITTSSEAITLDVPVNLDLSTLVGKRIMAVGRYNKNSRMMLISDAKDLEVLSKTPVPIPTNEPVATPTLIISESPSPTPTDMIELIIKE